MKTLMSLSLLFMMIHVSLAGPFFKSQQQNSEYSQQCSDKSSGGKCGTFKAQPQIIRRSDAKSHSRDSELSSAVNEGLGRGHSVPVGTKATSSKAGQSTGRVRRYASFSSSAPSQSRSTPAARAESSDHEEELIEEDEELEAELKSILDEMSASEFLELASDISEEDLIDDEDEEVSSDVTEIDSNSRTKRSIVFLLKKHLLKGHIRRKLLGKKLRHKARKIGHAARGAAGHAVRLGILGGGAIALGGAAGVGYSSANNN